MQIPRIPEITVQTVVCKQLINNWYISAFDLMAIFAYVYPVNTAIVLVPIMIFFTGNYKCHKGNQEGTNVFHFAILYN
jgi:hypothetical protein